MKKILFIIFAILLLALTLVGFSNNGTTVQATKIEISKLESKLKYTKEKYPIKAHHENLRMDCKDCHGEGPENLYKKLSTKNCLSCHKDYKTLADRTEFLGYDDNIHASPHYPKMDCNLCHSSHKPTQNYCVMCHSQDTMKNILVP